MRASVMILGGRAGVLSISRRGSGATRRRSVRPGLRLALHAGVRPRQPPYGFVQFCERHAAGVRARGSRRSSASRHRPSGSPSSTTSIARQPRDRARNRHRALRPDRLLDDPTTRGDCEDYVLLKRKRLMALGWPASALLSRWCATSGRGARRAYRPHHAGRLHPRQQDRRDQDLAQHALRFIMRQSYLNPRSGVARPAGEELQLPWPACAAPADRAPDVLPPAAAVPHRAASGPRRAARPSASAPGPLRHLADDLAGRAEHDGAGRDLLALGDQRAGADQALLADPGAVEDDGADADQRSAADGAAVQHHHVADGALRPRWRAESPGSVCSTQPSCTLARAPITIGSLSPRSTVLNQTLASSSIVTWPTSDGIVRHPVAAAGRHRDAVAVELVERPSSAYLRGGSGLLEVRVSRMAIWNW